MTLDNNETGKRKYAYNRNKKIDFILEIMEYPIAGISDIQSKGLMNLTDDDFVRLEAHKQETAALDKYNKLMNEDFDTLQDRYGSFEQAYFMVVKPLLVFDPKDLIKERLTDDENFVLSCYEASDFSDDFLLKVGASDSCRALMEIYRDITLLENEFEKGKVKTHSIF